MTIEAREREKESEENVKEESRQWRERGSFEVAALSPQARGVSLHCGGYVTKMVFVQKHPGSFGFGGLTRKYEKLPITVSLNFLCFLFDIFVFFFFSWIKKNKFHHLE